MKVTGFSFIKNAVKYGYQVNQSINSVLPVCDDFVMAVGDSDDGTKELILSLDEPKIKIIDSVWDETIMAGGKVLAVETNKAFHAVPSDSDWAFYIQGDEVVHEKDLEKIYKAMELYKNDERVDGLLFNYLHFWGSYDYIADSTKWYSHEIRIIRNSKKIYSYRDAQGFRKNDNEKLNVKKINADIFHYGWVRPPKAMQNKLLGAGKYWSDGNYDPEKIQFDKEEFDYAKIDTLKKFEGTHPQVMQSFIKEKNWHFDYDISRNNPKLKDRIKKTMRKITGRPVFEYKNYKLI